MALIRKAARQRDLGKIEVAARQERLRLSNADSPYIFADGATEMMMELAADLDGMAPDAASQFGESETRLFLFPKHFTNSK